MQTYLNFLIVFANLTFFNLSYNHLPLHSRTITQVISRNHENIFLFQLSSQIDIYTNPCYSSQRLQTFVYGYFLYTSLHVPSTCRNQSSRQILQVCFSLSQLHQCCFSFFLQYHSRSFFRLFHLFHLLLIQIFYWESCFQLFSLLFLIFRT